MLSDLPQDNDLAIIAKFKFREEVIKNKYSMEVKNDRQGGEGGKCII
jgi:hypothetical protein